ncbi:hypothetical protein BAMBUS_01500 [Brevundimonas phage vB_BpoS-Bambus]|nr:hypothetical protein BAMBUS_01500 [Brevundimonas phage vB_BpoS-Bambus]
MPRIKLILLAAALGAAPLALAACSPPSPVAVVPAPGNTANTGAPATDASRAWSYAQLGSLDDCAIGVLTYNEREFIIVSGQSGASSMACALAPVPAAAPQ